MPSDLDRMIKIAKRLEGTLERDLGAHGKGLHEKTSSVEHKLTPDLVRDLRAVATVRNKLVHEEGFDKIENRKDVFARADRAGKALAAIAQGAPRRRPYPAVIIVIAIAVMTLAIVLLRLVGII